MSVKKKYAIGDIVWIYGINRSNSTPTAGKVIKVVNLHDAGYNDDHYIIEISTHIEPILEIRTWHNISQDETGPVGLFRDIGNFESTIKFASKIGFAFDDNPNADSSVISDNVDEEVDPSIIYAALEKSQTDVTHQPLVLKQEKNRPRRTRKKVSKDA